MPKPRYTGYERTFWRRHAADFVVGAAPGDQTPLLRIIAVLKDMNR